MIQTCCFLRVGPYPCELSSLLILSNILCTAKTSSIGYCGVSMFPLAINRITAAASYLVSARGVSVLA